jgi:hypothetical protein
VRRLTVLYLLSVIFFAAGVSAILYYGQDLIPHGAEKLSIAKAPDIHQSGLMALFAENFRDPIAPLLLQFIVIVVATRAAGTLFSFFNQPSVIGEIVAGILLGPSLLGWL